MNLLNHPFDNEYILKKRKSIKKELLQKLESNTQIIIKKIAILGGSTTHDIKDVLELFLLNHGIQAEFYESEYGQYWQDAMFEPQELIEFKPDIVFIHTTNRNIKNFPRLGLTKAEVNHMLTAEYQHYEMMWDKLFTTYHPVIIQNNFELPFYRLMGNKEASDFHGRIHYINELNSYFYDYANSHENFYIHDINYISSCYGLDKWSDPFYWYMYKYALCVPAIPTFAFNLANIIKSIYGKNKKSLILDLDNTLWGGIVGDDGPENLEIGHETSLGQAYTEFQEYIKAHKNIGVILNVNSKNERENALAGLNHPDGTLRPEDFIYIMANWNPKSKNMMDIATQLNILPESMVFVDDNPAEREIVKAQIPGAAVPEVGTVETYIRAIDKCGYFEVTNLSGDDQKRNQMYKENAMRQQLEQSFTDYKDYLLSLEMTANIKPFEPVYMARIAQLTNKSNQFNLTTKRYTQSEIETVAASKDYIALYGKLKDKFGDNGVVSVVIGKKINTALSLELWIMSCRVLKRDMEAAMMDEMIRQCKTAGITKILGHYYPTAKNKMVADFYDLQGFTKTAEDSSGNTEWEFIIDETYKNKNTVIKVVKENE